MLFNRSFSHYLWGILSLIAISFFASGIISWIASNWSLFSKSAKFSLVEGGLFFSLMIGVLVYMREIHCSKPVFQSAIWLFLSAVLIGGLFALVGQTYQTGANAWQLFAIWTVLQLPLLWALPNIANGLLWGLTFNTAIALALVLQGQSFTELLWGIGLNLPLFFLAERFADKFHDSWRILANLLLTWLLVLFVTGGLLEPLSRFAFWLITAVIVWHYRRYYSCLILGFAYGVVEGNIVLLEAFDGTDRYILFPLFNLSATILATLLLNKRYSRFGFVLLTLLAVIATLSLLFFLFSILNIWNEHTLAIFALVIFGCAFLIPHALLRATAFTIAMVCGMLYVLSFTILYENNFADITIGLLLTLFAFTYYRENNFWLRVLLTLAGLLVLVSRYLPFMFESYQDEAFSIMAYYLYVLLPLLCLVAFTRQKQAIQALAWGVLLFLLGIEILQAVKFNDFFANAETEFRSLPELFHVITYGAFRPEKISLLWVFGLLSGFSPVWLSFWLVLQRCIQGTNILVLLLASVLLSIGFVAMPIVGVLFSLLLLAYFSHNRSLFVIGIAGLVAFLTLFYYNLTISLLFKSILLMGEAVLLGILAYCLRTPQEPSNDSRVKIGKAVPISAMVTLVTTLGLANFSIWQFENILTNGEKIVLKLAPRDPRSLMQGDYMALNYAILDGLNHLDIEDRNKQKQLYVRLHRDNGVDEFCGYTLASPPTEFEQCRDNIYLPIKYQQGNIKMAGQDFFFPEGRRVHFEQAEYGEFRFKDGKLLLLRLLDDKQNPL